GRWSDWGMNSHLGRDVQGATLGLVGFGRIGRAVARRGAGFGMQVLHHSRHDTGLAGWVGGLDELLPASDIVSLHVPLTTDPRPPIGSASQATRQRMARLACEGVRAILAGERPENLVTG